MEGYIPPPLLKHPTFEVQGHEQNDAELSWLCTRLMRMECKSILEIGSRTGKTLQSFSHACPLARLYSIDIARPAAWETTARELVQEGRYLEWITRDSHEPYSVKWAEAHAPFDFIFIDGDHTLPGVAQDWYNYSPLASCVGLHDIDGQGEGVRRLWQDLALVYPTSKKIAVPNSMGIGLIYMDERNSPLCPNCGGNAYGTPVKCEHCK